MKLHGCLCAATLNNGEAYKKFEELVLAQGGNLDTLKISDKVFSIKSDKAGYINKIDALKLGEIAKQIGAGRNTLEDKIDNFVYNHKIQIKKGDKYANEIRKKAPYR